MTYPLCAFEIAYELGSLKLTVDKLYENKIAQKVGIGREFAGHMDLTVGRLTIEEAVLDACVSSLIRFREELGRLLRGSLKSASYQSYYDERLSLRVSVDEEGNEWLTGRFVVVWNEGNVLTFSQKLPAGTAETVFAALTDCLTAMEVDLEEA